MHRLLTVALAVSLAGPCLADAAADEAAIRGRFAAWTEAFNARDAAGACDLFAPDLAYAVPDIPHGSYATMCGNLTRVLGTPDLGLRYDPPAIHEVIIEGDLAVVRLTWTITVSGRRRDRDHRRGGDGRLPAAAGRALVDRALHRLSHRAAAAAPVAGGSGAARERLPALA